VAFLSPNQVLLSAEERTATGEALQEEIDETFGSLRVLERAAKRMSRPA
jgi:superoxide dismutase